MVRYPDRLRELNLHACLKIYQYALHVVFLSFNRVRETIASLTLSDQKYLRSIIPQPFFRSVAKNTITFFILIYTDR